MIDFLMASPWYAIGAWVLIYISDYFWTIVASHLYRIVEEAVQNALCHASPRHISIRVSSEDGGILLTVRNDGKPLPPNVHATQGLGLKTMRYRANSIGGTLRLQRGESGGTVVRCFVPPSPRTGSVSVGATEKLPAPVRQRCRIRKAK